MANYNGGWKGWQVFTGLLILIFMVLAWVNLRLYIENIVRDLSYTRDDVAAIDKKTERIYTDVDRLKERADRQAEDIRRLNGMRDLEPPFERK